MTTNETQNQNMKTFTVTVTAKFPASGERPGTFEFEVNTKAEAIKKARRAMWDAGHTRQDGPLIFRATANQ